MDELSILRARVTVLEQRVERLHEYICKHHRFIRALFTEPVVPHTGHILDRRKKMKWKNPHQWLNDHARKYRRQLPALLDIIRRLVRALDADTIQHLFQEEMGKDGYFDDLPR